MTARYRLDPANSRFTVQAFAAGMLSFLGHNPTFAVGNWAGEVRLDPATAEGAWLRVTARAESLTLLDKVSAGDRRQIEETMWRDALETAAFPEITFESTEVAAGTAAGDERPLRIAGHMSLHGVVRPQQIDARLTVYTDGARLTGEFPLSQSEYRMRPVVALGGTLKLKDLLRVVFNVVGWKVDGGAE